MTVRLNRASQSYGVGSRTLNVNVGAAEKDFMLSFTRESWPPGLCVTVLVTWDDGSTQQHTCNGGTQFDDPPVPGDPPIVRALWTFTINKPAGVTSGTVKVTTAQAITSAIKAESI